MVGDDLLCLLLEEGLAVVAVLEVLVHQAVPEYLHQVLADVLLELREVRLVDPVSEFVLAVAPQDGDVGVRLVHPETLDLLVVVEVREVEKLPLDELRVGRLGERLVDVHLLEVLQDLPEYLALYRVVGDEFAVVAARCLAHCGRLGFRLGPVVGLGRRFGLRLGRSFPVRGLLLVRFLPLELLVALGRLTIAAHDTPRRGEVSAPYWNALFACSFIKILIGVTTTGARRDAGPETPCLS